MVQTTRRENLLDLNAASLMCQWLFWYYSNINWHINPGFHKLVYQIISNAEILLDCEMFIGHVHLLLYLSVSLWRFLPQISVAELFSVRGSFNEEESEFITSSLESSYFV